MDSDQRAGSMRGTPRCARTKTSSVAVMASVISCGRSGTRRTPLAGSIRGRFRSAWAGRIGVDRLLGTAVSADSIWNGAIRLIGAGFARAAWRLILIAPDVVASEPTDG